MMNPGYPNTNIQNLLMTLSVYKNNGPESLLHSSQVRFLAHGYIKLQKKGALIKTLQAKTSADTPKLKFHPLHMQAFLPYVYS